MLLEQDSTALARQVQAAHLALCAGDMRRASDLAQVAVDAGAEDAQLLTLAAYRNLHAGENESALRFAEHACRLTPDNIDALNAAASALRSAGRLEEAVSYFGRALAIVPDDVDLLVNASGAFEELRYSQRACDLLERAFRLDPRRADAAARLAYISTNRGDMQKGREFGLAALRLDHTQAFASLAVTAADIEEGNFEEAIARLRMLIAIPRIGRMIRATAERIIGDALDGLGRYEEAFAAYVRGGEALRVLYAPPAGSAVETGLARSRRISAYISRAPAVNWISAKGNSPVRSHVFLLGFPRSGTTLLTHVLNAHPEVIALDEPRTLSECSEFLANDAGLDRLAALSDDQLMPYRQAYWRRAAAAGFQGSTGVFIEKMPLYSEILCLIAKLFPDAKILFAVRDPRDVVFSCFRRRFAITPQMYEMLTLEGTAAYYDATMSLLEMYRSKIPLSVQEIHYEELVTDFAPRIRELCQFLEVDPNVSFAEYAERARKSDMMTPNAAQIAKGVRSESVGQWRSYAGHLKPVMPLLAPWIERFGYGGASCAASSP